MWRRKRPIPRASGMTGMQPVHLARIEDLRVAIVKVDRAACHHVAVLTSEFLLQLGLSPRAHALDLNAGAVPRTRSEATNRRVGSAAGPNLARLLPLLGPT